MSQIGGGAAEIKIKVDGFNHGIILFKTRSQMGISRTTE
jgi:hypothetical protein